MKARRPGTAKERGVALIIVTVTIAILGAVITDFSYNTRVDLEAAANARDQLRAEYLARSGINLSRLLIKVQQSVLDKARQYIGDIQIADFAPILLKAFGGDTDDQAALGSLIGIDTSSLKGLGAGKGQSFDVAITSDDGLININCGGGLNDATRQQYVFGVMQALLWPPKYNHVFENATANGQYVTRDDVAAAILDWADADLQRFEPQVAGKSQNGGAEDYRYDGLSTDSYKSHDNFYDSLDELNLVKGAGDEFQGSFKDMLTVYGGCKINLNAIRPEHWPIVAALIRATVKSDHATDPVLLDEYLLAGLAQSAISLAQLTGGFTSVSQFASLVSDPASAMKNAASGSGSGSGSASSTSGASGASGSSNLPSGVTGIPLDSTKLNNVATVGPRRMYRLDATGTVQRTQEKKIEVHIRAVYDTQHYNQNTTSSDVNDRMGTWVYWRED